MKKTIIGTIADAKLRLLNTSGLGVDDYILIVPPKSYKRLKKAMQSVEVNFVCGFEVKVDKRLDKMLFCLKRDYQS